MEQLTENIIKKITLRFFRHHYKFRLRYDDQPVTAKYDMEGAGGIIADGYYSYKKTDGKNFVATFEATSKESKAEVQFRPQKKVLFWDGLAVASVFTAFLFGINFLYQFHQLNEEELWFRAGFTIFSLAAAFGAFYFPAKQFRRYRYIYAVEQFKKYHADEQWVALGHDVFEDPNDKYFLELKNQCVFNGFGLLVVDNNLDTKILITPSRHDVFKGKRKGVTFLSQSKFLERLNKRANASWWGVFSSRLPSLMKKDTSIRRHRKTFYHQMLITGISFVLMGVIVSKELEKADFKVVDRETFRSKIAESRSNNVPEQEEFLADSASTPKRKSKKEGFWMLNDSTAAMSNTGQTTAVNNTREILYRGAGEAGIIYDCTRYYTFHDRVFLVQEGEYTSEAAVKKRLQEIIKSNIEATAIPLNCFINNQPGYLIYLGLIYPTEAEASRELKKFQGKKMLSRSDLKLRPLDPVVNN